MCLDVLQTTMGCATWQHCVMEIPGNYFCTVNPTLPPLVPSFAAWSTHGLNGHLGSNPIIATYLPHFPVPDRTEFTFNTPPFSYAPSTQQHDVIQLAKNNGSVSLAFKTEEKKFLLYVHGWTAGTYSFNNDFNIKSSTQNVYGKLVKQLVVFPGHTFDGILQFFENIKIIHWEGLPNPATAVHGISFSVGLLV